MPTLKDSQAYRDFGPAWTLINDPTAVQVVLVSVGVEHPEHPYNQLMVAQAPNNSYYAVYGAKVHAEHPILDALRITHQAPAAPGAVPLLEASTNFYKLYDREDLPEPL